MLRVFGGGRGDRGMKSAQRNVHLLIRCGLLCAYAFSMRFHGETAMTRSPRRFSGQTPVYQIGVAVAQRADVASTNVVQQSQKRKAGFFSRRSRRSTTEDLALTAHLHFKHSLQLQGI